MRQFDTQGRGGFVTKQGLAEGGSERARCFDQARERPIDRRRRTSRAGRPSFKEPPCRSKTHIKHQDATIQMIRGVLLCARRHQARGSGSGSSRPVLSMHFCASPPPADRPPPTFEALGIHPALIARLPPGVRAPTPDQCAAARVLLARPDNEASAAFAADAADAAPADCHRATALAGPTGSGKTLAWMLPAVTRWLRGRESGGGGGGGAVLVVAPSQELAAQVARVGRRLLLLPQEGPPGGRGAGGGGGGKRGATAASSSSSLSSSSTAAGSVQLLIGGASASRQRAALAELGADDTRPLSREGEGGAKREARARRRQAGRRLARERRRADRPPPAPLALVAGTPARLARLLADGSLDGRMFGALVLEEADQLASGLAAAAASGAAAAAAAAAAASGARREGGPFPAEAGGSDDEADESFGINPKGYAAALAAVCAAVPPRVRAGAVLVSATLRRPGALAALLPLLSPSPPSPPSHPQQQQQQHYATPVFIPDAAAAAESLAAAVPPAKRRPSPPPPPPSAARGALRPASGTRHVLVLAPPQHRAAAARAALRAVGARAALVFASERGGQRLEDTAAKLRSAGGGGGGGGGHGGGGGGGVWVLHGGLPAAQRKAQLDGFARAAAAAGTPSGGGRGGGGGRGRRRQEQRQEAQDGSKVDGDGDGDDDDDDDDDDTDDGDDDNPEKEWRRPDPAPLFADDARAAEPPPARRRQASPAAPARLAALVASDLAARGLDLPGLDAVVSLEPPCTAAAYAHRAGRVGRLGAGPGGGGGGGASFVLTVATAGEAPLVRRLCASLGVELLEAPRR